MTAAIIVKWCSSCSLGVCEYFDSRVTASGGLFEFLGASLVLRADRTRKATWKAQTYEGVSLDPCLEPPGQFLSTSIFIKKVAL